MKKVGFIGWRGMVGSVLMQRMQKENDFKHFASYFFSTSQAGLEAPSESHSQKLLDAHNLKDLETMDIIVTCQGGEYTNSVHSKLRENWKGVWIDASSSLRLKESTKLILDPLNQSDLLSSLKNGYVDFSGSNCTVSLMLIAIQSLLKKDLVEWVTSMTYQAASGAGAQNMKELLTQMGHLTKDLDLNQNILDIDQKVDGSLRSSEFPQEMFGAPLAGSLIPWIDQLMPNGQTKEEFKAQSEANKILNTENTIPIDGTCVRIGAMRSHSQALCVKLKSDIGLDEVNQMIQESSWVKFVSNNKEETLKELTPASVSGTLDIAVGRLRKMTLGERYLNCFTVGDQLLWGAAEPLRRFLRMICES